MNVRRSPVGQLTDDEETSSRPGESDVDLVPVNDEAQVLATPAVGRVRFYHVAGQRSHRAEDHVIPFPSYRKGERGKKPTPK